MMISALAIVLASVAGSAAAQGACDGPPAGTYDKCIGRDIFSLKACEDPDDQCVKFSKWYGQCRPKSNTRFEDDWLGIAVDCTDCGPDTRQIGEFNFASSIYCDVDFLGDDLTLSECNDLCSGGDYVACDRPVSDPATPTPCFGYFELFEGGCFMRNEDDTFFESWLLCPQNRAAARAAVQDFGTDDGPAADDAESLAADIAADEEASDGGVLAQRERARAGARK